METKNLPAPEPVSLFNIVKNHIFLTNRVSGALPNPLFNVRLIDLPRLAFLRGLRMWLYLSDAIKVTRNWPDLLLLHFNLLDSAKIEFVDGRVMHVDMKNHHSYDQLHFALSSKLLVPFKSAKRAEFVFRNHMLTLEGDTALRNADEIFFSDIYAAFDCTDRVVVDIGANIGDTAIYFALKGAKHVFALEPFDNLFACAKRNVESNGLADRITVINCAMSSEDGLARVDRNIHADVASRFETAEK